MGNITDYLSKIKTAIYGKDVRGAMHDAIKQVYDDAAQSGNANMEVTLARGTEPNLNARLEKMDEVAETTTAELATKAEKEEVRLKYTKLEPEDMSENTLALVTGQGTINLLSIPQEGSVSVDKFHPDIQDKIVAILSVIIAEGQPVGGGN